MEAEPTPIQELTEGGLDGLHGRSFSTMDAHALILALTVLGDALRLGLATPGALIAQMSRDVTQTQAEGALEVLCDEIKAWALPLRADSDSEDDPVLEWALGRRDEIESLLVGARRIFLPRGVLIDASKAAAGLVAALAARDLTCGGTLTRSEAERLLGYRRELIGERSWLDGLHWAPARLHPEAELAREARHPADAEPDSELDGMADAMKEALLERSAPSFDSLVGYATSGALAIWVEGAAQRDADVAEDLRDVIDTYREHGKTLSLVALRWMRDQATRPGESKRPIALGALNESDHRFAAADDDTPTDPLGAERRLGQLSPLDAEAVLHESPEELSLTVFEGQMKLRSVSLAGVFAKPSASGHTWTVTIPWSPGERLVELSIVDEHGSAFEESITWHDE